MSARLAPELLARLRPTERAGLSKARQLYLGLYGAITGGELPSGSLLPAVREMARQTGVGRNTVLAVYAQLGDEGLVRGERRRGTRVIHAAPPRGRAAPGAWSLSALAKALPGRANASAALAPGEPDANLFPQSAWRRALRHASALPSAQLRYRLRPLESLQAALARYLASHRGLVVEAERIVVTTSTRQSLLVAAALYADAGDTAWVESPGYAGAVLALRMLDLRLTPCEVDDQGLVPPTGGAVPRLVYTTPCFHYPSGVALSAPRRAHLLGLSARHGAVIFEDDYDSEFRDRSQPRPALAAHEGAALVIHAGTFSKILFPAARVAWMVVPSAHVDVANRCLRALGGGHATPAQQAVGELLDNGAIARHLVRARDLRASPRRLRRGAARARQRGVAGRRGGCTQLRRAAQAFVRSRASRTDARRTRHRRRCPRAHALAPAAAAPLQRPGDRARQRRSAGAAGCGRAAGPGDPRRGLSAPGAFSPSSSCRGRVPRSLGSSSAGGRAQFGISIGAIRSIDYLFS